MASQNAARLQSVDIDPEAIENTRKELEDQQIAECVGLHASDSVQFLMEFERSVDFI